MLVHMHIHFSFLRTMWNVNLLYKLTDLAAKDGKTSEGVALEGRINYTSAIGFYSDTPPHTRLLLVTPSFNLPIHDQLPSIGNKVSVSEPSQPVNITVRPTK